MCSSKPPVLPLNAPSLLPPSSILPFPLLFLLFLLSRKSICLAYSLIYVSKQPPKEALFCISPWLCSLMLPLHYSKTTYIVKS